MDREIKKAIRKKLISQRKALPVAEVKKAATEVLKKIKVLPEYLSAKSVAAYFPIQNEIDILPLINELLANNSKVLYLPQHITENNSYGLVQIKDLTKDLVIGKYNVPEPKKDLPLINLETLSAIDLWIIPGVAFDKKKNRCGFGKGYYDNLLATVSGKKVALAYDFQLLEEIPVHANDIAMDIIITPSHTV